MSGPTRPDPGRRPYLGYRDADRDTPFARFFTDQMAGLNKDVERAVELGPVAPPLLPPLAEAPALLDEGDGPVEDGIALLPDGEYRVAVRTPMPGVTAAMWDWWFGWHGSDPRRYKLWHPRAHLWAEWGDGDDAGRTGRARYVGRTSFVDEYLGSTLARAAIRFVPPGELGFDEGKLAAGGDHTVICARVGSSDHPVDVGWLVHEVRPTAEGAEMRSRFWLGGRQVQLRRPNAVGDRIARPVANRMIGDSRGAATDLLVHCSQEMTHLAAFLPELHAELGDT